jgi:hypothetical protein
MRFENTRAGLKMQISSTKSPLDLGYLSLFTYSAVYMIASTINFYITSYLKYKPSSVLSFRVEDGWCEPTTQGIGSHCFGDFYYSLRFISRDNPWNLEANPYPPFALMIFKPFEFLASQFPNNNYGLIAYLVFLFAMLSIVPLILVANKSISMRTGLLAFALIISSAPALVALDRGNVIIFCFPFLCFFFLNILRGNDRKALLFLTFVVLVKPQSIILGILFFRKRDFLSGIKRNALIVAFFCLAFLVYGFNTLEVFSSYARQIISFQTYSTPGSFSPINISISNSLQLFSEQVLGITIYHQLLTLTAIVILIIGASYIYFNFNSNRIQCVIIATILSITFPSVSFHYYLIYVLALSVTVLLMMVGNDNSIHVNIDEPKRYFSIRKLFLISLFTFVPWQIPLNLFTNRTGTDLSFHWILVSFVILLAAIPAVIVKRDKNTVTT